MGARLTTIVNAPLQLNGVALSDAYVTVGTLSQRIITRYRNDTIRQAYLLLGSSELLGNPVGLLQNLGTGVRDFFYEPAQGLVRALDAVKSPGPPQAPFFLVGVFKRSSLD